MFANHFIHRVAYKLACALLLPLCLGWGVRHLVAHEAAASVPAPAAPELPSHWQGRALRPLALSDVEERFARRFPGTLSRLTDGEQVLVLRDVHRPTRMLHPADDCYRGLGWRIAGRRLQLDGSQHLWRCFEAERGGVRQQVCERIVDAAGQGFTDTSAWYWAALTGQSTGPWQAVTVARSL
jgi:hypothetical protein